MLAVMKKIKYLAICPARGGSKRVLGKNIRNVNGMPLFYWSIKYGKESTKIDRLVVSTEDKEIKETAEIYDVEVLDRPRELSKDNVPDQPVLQHALESIPAENIVLLRPTSPIRINHIIDKCIEVYEREKPDSFVAGFINKEYEAFSKPFTYSQKERGWFQNSGCCEIHRADVILSGKPYGEKQFKYVVPDLYNYEIDNEVELIMVDALMRHLEIRA